VARGIRGQQEFHDEKNLTSKEKSKILEVLMSQERVLTLLYDKTFPPRSVQPNTLLKQMNFSESRHVLKPSESIHTFNYLNAAGKFNEIPEDDLENLEKEIEQVIQSSHGRHHNAEIRDKVDEKLTSMADRINRNRGKTAGTGQRRHRMVKQGSLGGPIAAYQPLLSAKYPRSFV
jgi:ElaB/YqjD/DUF883 family membrane-anchored ribosome-binding protein